MQKTESPLSLAIILCLITAIISLLLAFSNHLTKDTISLNEKKEQQVAMKAVLGADTYMRMEIDKHPMVKNVFEAKRRGHLKGYCVNVSPVGFGGEIDLMVGIDLRQNITGIKIISMSETAGLGSKAQDEKFTDQFIGKKSQLAIIKNGTAKEDEIVALTGATVTSHAVKDGVNIALETINKLKEGENE